MTPPQASHTSPQEPGEARRRRVEGPGRTRLHNIPRMPRSDAQSTQSQPKKPKRPQKETKTRPKQSAQGANSKNTICSFTFLGRRGLQANVTKT